MIPANVIPSTSTTSAALGQLFPFVEPASADIADFNQLLGDFNQLLGDGNQLSLMTSLSTPELTLSLSADNNPVNALPQETPESLSSTLTQGAEMALQEPLPLMSQPILVEALNDKQIDAQAESVFQGLERFTSPPIKASLLSTSNEPAAEHTQTVLHNPPQTTQINASKLAGEQVPIDIAKHSEQVMKTDPLLQNGLIMAEENKVPTTISPALATLKTKVVQQFNQPTPVAQTAQGKLGTHQVMETPLADISQLGDNEAVIFASTPVSAISLASMLKSPANVGELMSTPLMQGASVTSIEAQFGNHTQSSTSQDHDQAQTQKDGLTVFSEAAEISDTESSEEDFLLESANFLTASSSSNALLTTPLNLRKPQWTQGVAQRVQAMLNQSMNQLEVRLDPLGLGPMKISLKLDEQSKAHVTLSAQHGLTRDMLENALPRLKELLAQENIELASALINSGDEQSSSQQDGSSSSHKATSDLSDDAANLAVNINMNEPKSTDNNRIDQYV